MYKALPEDAAAAVPVEAGENAYKNDASVHTAIRTALIPTGYEHTASTPNVRLTWVSGGGTPTAGAFRLTVHYIVRDRAAFSQG